VSWLLTDRDYAEASRELEVLEGRRTTLSPYLRHHADALRALLEGRNGDAYVAVREARKLLPNDALTAFHFASYAGDANRLHEAVETLTAPLDWARFHARSGVLGGAYFWHLTTMLHRLGEHERELAEIRRGQQLHPELPWLLGPATYALAALGRLNEMERAVAERTSLASAAQRGHFLMFVGLELRAHGHGEAAERMLARSVEAFRGTSAQEARGQEGMLAIALKLTGRCGEARAILRRFARESPDVTNLAGDRAVVEALCGDRAEARRISDALGRLTRPYLLGQNNFVRARIAAQLGEKDAAVDLLRMAYAQGFGSFDQNWVHLEPALESLRGYPPYEELMKPM